MAFWIEPLLAMLRRGQPATLVHIAKVEGSGPREPGAVMLVGPDELHGTIGGGELEYRAVKQARALAPTGRGAIDQTSLGPEIDQCCGGRVTLAYEPFGATDVALVEDLLQKAHGSVPIWRQTEISAGGDVRRDFIDTEPGDLPADTEMAVMTERLNPDHIAVYIFGAGHVGVATMRALAPLGFEVTWIDDRAGLMSADAVARKLELAIPESAVEQAPSNAYYLVMTHSHDLDLKICEAVLRRGDAAYLGLIGSKSKRAHFLHRLGETGLDVSRLTCPVGLPNILSKEPAVIAASIAADLLLRRERGVSHAEK
ncbi:xanthine dehydrogenase accessory protein XdhC [Flaviflagellibacter deserti]|uniref:Xanthine dehydrogenase accessory protein XdhC n=1 Tax=Flaviflagellibacter deserti TaxID=2267266 RepID=A0ABV9Z107_9HYPH